MFVDPGGLSVSCYIGWGVIFIPGVDFYVFSRRIRSYLYRSGHERLFMPSPL